MTNKLLKGATRRTLLTAMASAAAVLFLDPLQACAADTSGIHGFFNDDRNQFVDVWLNTSGTLTVKVSNGRPWRPMWVVMHVAFMSGGQVVGRKDYSRVLRITRSRRSRERALVQVCESWLRRRDGNQCYNEQRSSLGASVGRMGSRYLGVLDVLGHFSN